MYTRKAVGQSTPNTWGIVFHLSINRPAENLCLKRKGLGFVVRELVFSLLIRVRVGVRVVAMHVWKLFCGWKSVAYFSTTKK